MVVTVTGWIFYLLLIDSLGANLVSWFYADWYKKQFGGWTKHFPASKGWCGYYLILVLFIGYLIYQTGGLGF